MTETEAKTQSSRRAVLVIRILVLVALVLALVVAVRYRMLAGDLQRAVNLVEERQFEPAQKLLQQIMDRPLAAFRIRDKARQTLGVCYAEMASDLAEKERTAAGYQKALDLLDRAKKTMGSTPEIERRIKEYSEYLEKSKPIAPAPAPAPANP